MVDAVCRHRRDTAGRILVCRKIKMCMRNWFFIGMVLLSALLATQCTNTSKSENMITHTVFFKLIHEKGSDAEADFLKKALALGSIPSVQNLRSVEEVSPKNSFEFGLVMQFEDQAAYDAYNNHPDHVDFVENVWKKEVAEFMEVDYVPRNP